MKKQLIASFLLGASLVLLFGDPASVALAVPLILIAWWLAPHSPSKHLPGGTLAPFSDLPLGTRFRYPGGKQIWTIIGQRRERENGAIWGTLAQWEPDMLQKGRWTGQSICSHLPESEGGDCPELVEAID